MKSMKQHVTAALLCACAAVGADVLMAGTSMADEFTIYVVRHAEKAVAESDPPLSETGQKRALVLAQMLQKANLKAIYSTPYQRTQQTAQPLAEKLGLAVQDYRPAQAEELIVQLKNAAQNALIVGHSNTVPALVRALGGESENLTEQDYGDLFQITLHGCKDVVDSCQVHQARLFVPVAEVDH